MEEMYEEEKIKVERERKIERLMQKKLLVDEVLKGQKGKMVDIEEKIKGLKGI